MCLRARKIYFFGLSILITAVLSFSGTAQEAEIDLSVSVSSEASTVPILSNFYYTVYLENLGTVPATFISLSDTLPTEVEFISSPDSCNISDRVVTCSISDLAPGESATLTYTVRAVSPGTNTSNQVTVSAAESDSNMENNTSSVSINITVPQPADISLTAFTGSSQINIGDIIEFGFAITSVDTIPVYQTRIEFVLPDSFEFVSLTGCTDAGTLIRCDIDTVTADTPGYVNLQIRAIESGTVSLSATASHMESDPDESNNRIELAFNISNPSSDAADIQLDLTPSHSQFVIGEPVTFTFSVINFGPADATGLSVIHELPSELELISSPDCDVMNTRFVICEVGALSSGETVFGTLTLSATGAAEAITSTASVAGNELDPNLLNNIRSITLPGIEEIPSTSTPIIVTTTPVPLPAVTATPLVITATPSSVELLETPGATTGNSETETDTDDDPSGEITSDNADETTSNNNENSGNESIPDDAAPGDIYGWTRYESADLIQVTGRWALRSMSNASQRGYHESRDSGATLRYPFEGDGIRIGYRSEVNGALFQIILDGEFLDTYDTNFENINAPAMRQSFVTQPYWVTPGYHVVDIQCLADGDGSEGCNIDFIEIFRGPPMPDRADNSSSDVDNAVVVENVELISAPPTITPAPTPVPDSIITVDVLVSVDVNTNDRVDANEGVEDITVRVVDVLNNTVLASAVTDSSGAVRIRVVAPNDVVLLIPVLGETFYVRRRGQQINETWNLLLDPANVPGLIP